ncbi:MAG: hypothetical protein ACE5HO_11290 [bacterium]
MKAPLSKKVRKVLSSPKDAKAFADAIRNNFQDEKEAEVELPSGQKMRIRKLDTNEH